MGLSSKKKLLVVSPHFPPTDAPDAHRVRMNAAGYREAGWEPTLLCVDPAHTGRPLDGRLLRTVPADLPVRRVHARGRAWSSLGVSAIGLRAYRALAAEGDQLLSSGDFDLVFISTTAFPVMALGRRWLESHGVPYVLDMQDPWFTVPAETLPFQRRGVRHAVMRRLHGFLERRTMPKAGGIVSVSPRYVEALSKRYPELQRQPAEVIPFGFSHVDFAVAREVGNTWHALARARQVGWPLALCAGRINEAMLPSVAALLAAMARGTAHGGATLGAMSLMLLGSEYSGAAGSGRVAALANRMGLKNRVHEESARLPLLDALRSMQEADILVVVGSGDLSYQPSRLYQCLATGKPVVVVAARESVLAREAARFPNVAYLPTESSDEVFRAFSTALDKVTSRGAIDLKTIASALAPYDAAQLSASEADVFERVVNQHALRGRHAG